MHGQGILSTLNKSPSPPPSSLFILTLRLSLLPPSPSLLTHWHSGAKKSTMALVSTAKLYNILGSFPALPEGK